MKRPYKIIRIVTVAVAICLLTVDPAAACRLLGNRRCCCYVCPPCEEMTCTKAVPGRDAGEQKPAESADALPIQPSPSDAPPGASTSDGTIVPNQQPTPNNDRSQTVPARSAAPEAAAVKSTATLTFGEQQHVPSPANLDRPTKEPAVIHEPALGPLGVAPGPRDPASIDPAATAPVAAPTAEIANSPVDSPVAAAAPSAIEVSPKTDREPVTPSATAQRTDIQRPAAIEPAPQATVKRPSESTSTTSPSPLRPTSRQPAAALPTPPKTAVDAPGFPAAADDPFAPVSPKTPQPMEDDPFAPLPQAKPPVSAPAAPLTAEPTNLRAAEALTLGPDGKLPIREWRDNSGQFRIKAKLVLILEGKVRLLKESGRTTTVTLDRLSEQDRAYVNEVISRFGNDLTTLDQLAAR